jgi:hypothetical protein
LQPPALNWARPLQAPTSHRIVVLAFDGIGLYEQLQQLSRFAVSSGNSATTCITVVATQQTLHQAKLNR